MDTSYVEVLRKLEMPIIVITEDSDGEYDAEQESDSDAEIVELEKRRGVREEEEEKDEKEEDTKTIKGPPGDIFNDQENIDVEDTKLSDETAEIKVEANTKINESMDKDKELNVISNSVEEKNLSDKPLFVEEKTIDESQPEVNTGDVKIQKRVVEETKESVVEENRATDETNQQKTSDKQEEIKVSSDIDRELIEKLVSLHGGWHDAELKKNIKQTPKGWQLISV